MKKMHHKFTESALVELQSDLKDGKNGRDVRNIVEEVEFCQSVRTGAQREYSLAYLKELTKEDVKEARANRSKMMGDDVPDLISQEAENGMTSVPLSMAASLAGAISQGDV